MRQAEQASNPVAAEHRQRYNAGDPQQKTRSCRQNNAHADGGAQQHNGNLKEGLSTESNAGIPTSVRRPCCSDSRAYQDRQYQRFQPGSAENQFLQALQPDREKCHANTQKKTRQQRLKVVQGDTGLDRAMSPAG